jgi:hypothetical protein
MRSMSRGAGPRTAALARNAGIFVRILVPAGAALALVAVLTGRDLEVEGDLHLVAPDRIVSGETMPVRAQLYAHLRRPEGAELLAAKTAVELRVGGRVAARGTLRPSHARSLDGMLALPPGLRGRAVIAAEAQLDGELVRSERAIELTGSGAAFAPALRPRPLRALQRFAPGPVQRRSSEAEPPSSLTLQIEGGACVPERRCSALVHVGAPAASVRVLASASVMPDARSAAPSQPTSGVVALRFVTHGPEAELRIAAERAGVQVAARSFRLPVALGADALLELPRVLPAPAAPRAGLQQEEHGCIVDAFLAGRWLRTGALRDCRGGEALPFGVLQAGLWRLQLRRDPFTSDGAAVATLYARAPGESDAGVLERLAHAAIERDPDDALARAVREQPQAHVADFAGSARYLLALLDAGVLALPEPASGHPRALAQLEATRSRARKFALFALALCALTLGLHVAQRGLSAADEASRLMAAAGEEAGRLDRQRLRMTLRVLATVSSLLLAFAAIAAYVIARGAAP